METGCFFFSSCILSIIFSVFRCIRVHPSLVFLGGSEVAREDLLLAVVGVVVAMGSGHTVFLENRVRSGDAILLMIVSDYDMSILRIGSGEGENGKIEVDCLV